MPKVRPVELDLWFNAEDGFIDLAQSASLVNRIFLRQGMQFAVESITLFAAPETAANQTVTIHRLPNHWPMLNSWVRCYHAWRDSQDQVLEDNPSIAAAYRDFKVCFNTAHAPNPSNNNWSNKLPIGYAISGGTASYEWQASQVAIPNDPVAGATEEYFLHSLGTDAAASGPGAGDGSKGMIHGYALARSRPQTQDPNVPETESWLIELFDLGDNDTEIWTNVREKNDEPPYLIDQDSGTEYYPGGGNQGQDAGEQAADLQCTQFQRSARAPGFFANCGLLAVVGTQSEGDDLADARIRIRMVPGMYKGFMARPMQDVN